VDEPKEISVELRNKGKSAGTLLVALSFKPAKQKKSASDENKSAKANKAAKDKEAEAEEIAASATAEDESEDESEDEENDDGVAAAAAKKDGAQKSAGDQDLVFTIIKGRKLKNVQKVFAQEPYVKVVINGESQQTLTSSGVNPSWQENKHNVLSFALSGGAPKSVEFQVMDKEKVFKDRPIGPAVVPFEQCAAHKPDEEMEVELLDAKGKSAGTLIVGVRVPSRLRLTSSSNAKKDKKQRLDGQL
jgi:Ca2+-dependent lipid-binding protein